jgi:hypothetical protein
MKLLKIVGSILVAVALLPAEKIKAQDISGSVYSVDGIGDLKWKGSALNRALGGTGIGLRDIYNLNTANPAAYTAIASPVSKFFEFGGYAENNTFRNSASSTNYQAGTISSLNYWFKFSPKFAGVAGMAPLSGSSYNVTSNQAISAGASVIPVNYEGSGGLNQFYLGNSYQIIKNLSIGVNASLILGSVNKRASTSANSFSGSLESNTKLFAQGANFDVGIQYFFNLKQSQFTFGATYKTSTALSGFNQTILTTLSSGATRETDKLSIDYILPEQYGAGFSYMRKRIVLAADITFQEWKKAKLETGLVKKDVFRYSVGGEYKGNLETSNYLKAISWRAGFYSQDYYLILRNTQLNSVGYTIGAGLPLNGNFATVNVNYSSTNFGTTANGLVQQESNKFSVDVIIRDIWGIKRKFD